MNYFKSMILSIYEKIPNFGKQAEPNQLGPPKKSIQQFLIYIFYVLVSDFLPRKK